MIRVAVAVVVGSVVFATVLAAASSFSLSALPLAAGSSAIPRCDPDGFAEILPGDFTTSAIVELKYTAVTVRDISEACSGGQLQLQLIDASSNQIPNGSGSLALQAGSTMTCTAGVCEASVPFATAVDGAEQANIQAANIVIVEP